MELYEGMLLSTLLLESDDTDIETFDDILEAIDSGQLVIGEF